MYAAVLAHFTGGLIEITKARGMAAFTATKFIVAQIFQLGRIFRAEIVFDDELEESRAPLTKVGLTGEPFEI
jgi:hypothetical protein